LFQGDWKRLEEVIVSTEIVFGWEWFVFPMATIGYFQLLRYLNLRYARKRWLSDEEILTQIARLKGCSEYDLFFKSAEDWRITDARIDGDFKNYLKGEQLPYYVKDFVRKTRAEVNPK
jgi:hypothetical protein